MDATRYDIIIVGGGLIGLTMAAAWLRFLPGLRLALIERRPFAAPRDLRASAIAAGARRAFEQIGIWSAVAEVASPIRAMRITDSGRGDIARPLLLDFGGEASPGEPFAHMVPNTALAAALIKAVEAGGATLIAPASVEGFIADADLARLTLADGRVLEARLVVASDGAHSALRRMAGIATVDHAYGQAGLVTTIGHALDHEGIAWEHFLPAGPFASLPLAGRRSSLVWTETLPEAERLKALPPAELAIAIEAAMGSCLGTVTLEEPVQAFPLKLQIARDFVAPRLALVGDAAHVIHPVAGQGLNLGLKDVAALVEVTAEAMRLGLDPGAADVLERYQRWRRLDTALMSAATDGLNRLFSNDNAPLRALRDLGLGLVDRLPPLKSALIAEAAGITRAGPRLLRGLPV